MDNSGTDRQARGNGTLRDAPGAYRASEPPSSPAARKRAKLFANGRSQAVRLPKEFRMPGAEVYVHREGKRIVLEPVEEPAVDANGWPVGFWEALHEQSRGVDWSGFELPPDLPPPDEEFADLFGDDE